MRAAQATLRPPWRADRKLPPVTVNVVLVGEVNPPPLGAFVRMVAQLGGYVNRKRADPPGPQTIGIGLQRMHDFATCWELSGPDADANP